MSPEYGATCGFFPVDEQTLEYLRLTGRPDDRIELVEAYCKQNGSGTTRPTAARLLAGRRARPLDASSRAWPGRGGRRTASRSRARRRLPRSSSAPSASTTATAHDQASPTRSRPATRSRAGARPRGPAPAARATAERRRRSRSPRRRAAVAVEVDGETFELEHGAVVIAAITSCTNTSNPQVMVAAALLAKNAVERGLRRKPWVKSSLAPGSKVVTEYYDAAGLHARTSRSSASTPSATAARPASGTRARCRRRSRRRSRRATSSRAPCSPGTATSRRASTPR